MTQAADEILVPPRGRSVMSATATGTAFQGVYALAQFIILAALMRYVGAERFGMWATVWSIGAWAMVTHLGLGHALLTELGGCAASDRRRAGRLLTTACVSVCAISVCLIGVVLVFGPALNWAAILNVQSAQAVREARPVALTALVVALAGIPFSMGGTALLAVQRGRAMFLSQIAAHVACVVLVVWGVALGWTLPVLTAAAFSPPILAGLMQWGLLTTGRGALRPGRWDGRVARALFGAGAMFFVMELLGIGMMQTGPLIIAVRLGAEAVTPYAAAFRLIGLMLAVYGVVMLAYWPAYADAAGRGDRVWFIRALNWSWLKTLTVWLVGSAGILAFGDPFVRWWLGPAAAPGWTLTVWMLVFVGLQGALLWLTTPLKGIGMLRVQVVSGAAMTLGFVPLAFGLCGRYGAAGVPMAQSIMILLIGLPMNGRALRQALRRFGHADTPGQGGGR